jgi:YbbR domain-containing protein
MNNRLGLKVISVLLGVFAWVYVNLVIPPQVRRTIVAEITYRNKPELMKIMPESPRVEIEIEGNRRDFIMSDVEKAEALVDLYNLRPGKAILPVKVTPASGLSVKSVNPAQIQIEAVELLRKTVAVDAIIRGQPAEGYLAEDPRLDPEEVTIEGPESVIDKIKTCQIVVSLEQVKNSISEKKSVSLVMEPGTNHQNISVFPDKVNVDVTVKQGYPKKVVSLARPVFLNKPPEGKKLEEYHIFPEKLMISGPARLLEQIDEIGFEPIDLARLSETASRALKMDLPSERIKLEGKTRPSIQIRLVEVPVTRYLKGLSFELEKAGNQHTAVSVSSYTIELEGLVKNLNSIKRSDLIMRLNIKNMEPGEYQVPLTVPSGLPENVRVVGIAPEKVEIKISEFENKEFLKEDVVATDTENSIPDQAAEPSGSAPEKEEE